MVVEQDIKEEKDLQGQKTIFHDLMTNDQLRPEEKAVERLEFEGMGLVAAG